VGHSRGAGHRSQHRSGRRRIHLPHDRQRRPQLTSANLTAIRAPSHKRTALCRYGPSRSRLAIGPERTALRISPGNPFNDMSETDACSVYIALTAALRPLGWRTCTYWGRASECVLGWLGNSPLRRRRCRWVGDAAFLAQLTLDRP